MGIQNLDSPEWLFFFPCNDDTLVDFSTNEIRDNSKGFKLTLPESHAKGKNRPFGGLYILPDAIQMKPCRGDIKQPSLAIDKKFFRFFLLDAYFYPGNEMPVKQAYRLYYDDLGNLFYERLNYASGDGNMPRLMGLSRAQDGEYPP